ncbi:MAG: DUF2334 domain-containing protein [Myxococcales bacterium]|nr:DUF2334 domain-containing protein [Myxococcales bacterium]
MKYVILRDDDCNATTPPSLLETLYRPFLDRGMPVHLAAIPEVRTDIIAPHGEVEGFVLGDARGKAETHPIGENQALLDYLRKEPGYRVLQHGLRHEFVDGHCEFDRHDAHDLSFRLDRGLALFAEAGLPRASTFVAPQDRLSRAAVREITSRFPILSTGWMNRDRLPHRWWGPYLYEQKVRHRSAFRLGPTAYFTHPGCILSYHRDPSTILPAIQAEVERRDVMVIVSHHWEYFAHGKENRPLMDALWETGDWLAGRKDIQVTHFDEVAAQLDSVVPFR